MTNATLNISGSGVGTGLQSILMCDDIEPGAIAGYQICKAVYVFHPLGAKMVEAPVRIAMSQPREITMSSLPGLELRLRKQFNSQWEADSISRHIFNTVTLSRVYGISAVCLMCDEIEPLAPIDYPKLYKQTISFNVLDPLNISGSVVLNQNPNSPNFLKVDGISIAGTPYHRSRAVVMMNEQPIYLEYSSSGFGYVGRSVYQRALFPLKSFVQSMMTDDMVTKKAGIIVAKIKPGGSIIDQAMSFFGAAKRLVVKEAVTGNIISIGNDDDVSAIDLTNVQPAHDSARKHVLENIAAADDMPAQLLNSETFAEGFGEGTEDAKKVATYIDRKREEMAPLYAYFDKITMYRAWNEEFYKTIQTEFPEEYGSVPYQTAFIQWQNDFRAAWPSLLIEPDSEKVKVDDVKLRATIGYVDALYDKLDPENKATLIEWASDAINDLKMMFGAQLTLDYDALRAYVPPEKVTDGSDGQHGENFKPKSDSLVALNAAVGKLPPSVTQIVPYRKTV